MSTDRDDGRSSGMLTDYRAHYQADAEAIVDPEELDPIRHASEHRRLATLVRLLGLQRGERLLDAGCGSGWLAARCRRAGARVWAMDIARRGVSGVRRRFPEIDCFQVGDLYHLPFGDRAFDALVLSEVVEHIEDIDAALGEARRVVKPGGRVLISVPYREKIVEHLCIHCNRLTPANAHLHSFDQEGLTGLMRRAGLSPHKSLLLNNKLLELTGFPRLSRSWPHGCWRLVDRLFNRLVPRPGFLCVLAVRTD